MVFQDGSDSVDRCSELKSVFGDPVKAGLVCDTEVEKSRFEAAVVAVVVTKRSLSVSV